MRADSPQVPSCRHGFAVWLQNCLKMRRDCPAHRETVSTVSTQITWMPGLMTPSSLRQRCLADNVVKPLSMLPGRQASVNVAWPTSLCQCCQADKPLSVLPGRQASVNVAWPTSLCQCCLANKLSNPCKGRLAHRLLWYQGGPKPHT